jgi:hypothetical protein
MLDESNKATFSKIEQIIFESFGRTNTEIKENQTIIEAQISNCVE